MGIGYGSGGAVCESSSPQMLRRIDPCMTDSLIDKKQRLEGELAQVNEALEALKANPEIERVFNLVLKVMR